MERGFTRVTLQIAGTVLVWLACFTAIYVFGALACVRGLAVTSMDSPIVIDVAAVLLVLSAAAFTLWQVRRAVRQHRAGDGMGFIPSLALGLGMFVLLGLVMLSLPVLLARPLCAGQPELGMQIEVLARARR